MPAASSRSAAPVVVLVHGLGGDPSDMTALSARLRAAGRQTLVVALPLRGVVPIAESAAALETALTPVAGRVDLVGYSLGGVVVRAWIEQYGGASRVDHVVTIASPHHGATLAGLVDASRCIGACLELRPGSPFLLELNDGDETPDGPTWVTLRTSLDRTVEPVDSASLDGALNILLQDVCPDSTVGHGSIGRDPLPVGLVVRALDDRLPTAPPPPECAGVRAEGAG